MMPKLRVVSTLMLIVACGPGGLAPGGPSLRSESSAATTPIGSAVTFGGGKVQFGAIAFDGAGHAVVAGSFLGSVDFADGKGPYLATTVYRGFLASLTSAGTVSWVHVLDARLDESALFSLAVDLAGNIYLYGKWNTPVSFDPSGTGAIPKNHGRTSFLTKFLQNGSFAWTRSIDGGGTAGIATDAAGEIFYAGNFSGTVNLYPDDGSGSGADYAFTQSDANGQQGSGAFVTKLNADGSYAWSAAWAPAYGNVFGFARVFVDAPGNITLLGGLFGAMDFDPTPGVDVLENTQLNEGGYAGGATTFTRINADRSYGWTQSLAYAARVVAAASDAEGNVYVAGNFASSINIAPAPDEDVLTNIGGSTELFVTRFNADGSYGWSRNTLSFPGAAAVSRSIAVIPGGDVLVGGSFQGDVPFDWSTDGDSLASNGRTAGFVLRTGPDATYRGTFMLGDGALTLGAGGGRAGIISNLVSGAELGGWSGVTASSPGGSYALTWPY